MIVQISEEVAVLLKALREPELIVALKRLHLLGHHTFHLAHVLHPTGRDGRPLRVPVANWTSSAWIEASFRKRAHAKSPERSRSHQRNDRSIYESSLSPAAWSAPNSDPRREFLGDSADAPERAYRMQLDGPISAEGP